jgi:hypothetical protein
VLVTLAAGFPAQGGDGDVVILVRPEAGDGEDSDRRAVDADRDSPAGRCVARRRQGEGGVEGTGVADGVDPSDFK